MPCARNVGSVARGPHDAHVSLFTEEDSRMKTLRSVISLLVLTALVAMVTLPSVAISHTATLSAAAPVAGADVPGYLQDISVTIRASNSEGSGVAVSRDGVTYIWTAAHVVDGLRTTRMVIDPKTGTRRSVVEFRDAKIIKTHLENGRAVGHSEMYAEVIRYSGADHGHDLALLRVRKKDFVKVSAKFHLDKNIPVLGTRLFHVGSLLGQQGSNSMTSGIMSQHGRLIGKTVYDQTTVTAFPGSSGGGVYTTDGKYVGMLVRGAGEGFNLIVPVRRMHNWAKRAGVEWALDPRVKVPPAADLQKMPIEDVGASFSKGEGKSIRDKLIDKQFPYRIRPYAPFGFLRIPRLTAPSLNDSP